MANEFVDGKDLDLVNLKARNAEVLCALAQVFIGPDVGEIVPFKDLVLDIDDLMSYQTEETRNDLNTGLKAIQSPFLRWIGLQLPFSLGRFSKLSLEKRQDLVERLKKGEEEVQRQFYAGFNNLICSSFYGNQASWDELQYEGVSVDNQCVLQGHRWRPDDDRPVEPCTPGGPC